MITLTCIFAQLFDIYTFLVFLNMLLIKNVLQNISAIYTCTNTPYEMPIQYVIKLSYSVTIKFLYCTVSNNFVTLNVSSEGSDTTLVIFSFFLSTVLPDIYNNS
jgi:hypothetical protein